MAVGYPAEDTLVAVAEASKAVASKEGDRVEEGLPVVAVTEEAC